MNTILFVNDSKILQKTKDGLMLDQNLCPVYNELLSRGYLLSNLNVSYTLSFFERFHYRIINPSFFIPRQMFFFNDSSHSLDAYLDFSKVSKFKRKIFWYLYSNILKIVKRINPSLIVLTCSYGFNYLFVLAAKKLGIPSVELQHGIIHPSHWGYFKKRNKDYLFPDYFIVYSKYEKGILKKSPYDKYSRILDLGCPRYDQLYKYSPQKSRKEILRKYHVPSNYKIVFWPTQTHDKLMRILHENKVNADQVFKAIKKSNKWWLIIKFHPGENQRRSFEFYKQFAKKNNLERITILPFYAESTYDLISISDALILKNSTVGLEAILMGKPIINLSVISSLDQSTFKELDSSIFVKDYKDLVDALKNIQTKIYLKKFRQERRKFIANHFNNFGNATKAVVGFIESCLK